MLIKYKLVQVINNLALPALLHMGIDTLAGDQLQLYYLKVSIVFSNDWGI